MNIRIALGGDAHPSSYTTRLQRKLEAMERWARSREVLCRRSALLAYFNEKCAPQERCCDLCDERVATGGVAPVAEDVTEDGKLVLAAIIETGTRIYYTVCVRVRVRV